MKAIPGTQLHAQNIFCIGRNYAEHAKELGNAVPTEPIVFLKPTSALCYDGEKILLPARSTRVDHEVEIVVAIGRGGKNISTADAPSHIGGLGVGIDFTARDLQDKAKEKGLPWTLSKGFDTFAPISSFIAPPKDGADLARLEIELTVNGELRQKGSSAEMIFPIAKLIEYLSQNFTLSPGDLIFTGTPKGVAPLKSGDICEARLAFPSQAQTTLKIKIF